MNTQTVTNCIARVIRCFLATNFFPYTWFCRRCSYNKRCTCLICYRQEQTRLEKFAKGFDLVVDYGWLTIIAAPLFWVLEWFHKLTGNWGWAIILVTIALKAAFFPLSAASYKSMAKMKTLGPRPSRHCQSAEYQTRHRLH